MQNETMHCPSVLCAKEFVCCSCIQCQTTADSLLQIPDVSRSTYSCIAYSQWCEILCFKSQMFLDLQISFFSTANLQSFILWSVV